jgi:hypothetical protein
MIESKLKIKTITCHDVYNFGATLQAYALSKYLSDKGHDVEIIDYKPDYLTFDLWAIGKKWNKNVFLKIAYFIFVVPRRLSMKKRREKFDKFKINKLNITPEKYVSFSELKDSPPKADVFFAGSDQIWNPLLPNGKDPSFFLDFIEGNSLRASYAASFSVKEIPIELKETIKNNLLKFDFISIREPSALPILDDLKIKNAEVVVDPVFLLDSQEWNEIASLPINEKYILVYDQENNKLLKEIALKLKKEFDIKIIAIETLYPMSFANTRIRDAGPEDFLGLIKNCEICLTNSFHCISFSLIFKKSFYLFKRTHLDVNSRMTDLLEYLNLADRIINENNNNVNLSVIKYQNIQELLNKRILSSKDYIKNVIEKATDKHEEINN